MKFCILALLAAVAGCTTTFMRLSDAEAQACAAPNAQCRVLTIEDMRRFWDNARRDGYQAGVKSL